MNPHFIETLFTIFFLCCILIAIYYWGKMRAANEMEREGLRAQRRRTFKRMGVLGVGAFCVLLVLALIFDRSGDDRKLTISVKITPENDSVYTVEWNDTLGSGQRYGTIERPEELWCTITNDERDTLGYYHGLSTAQRFTYIVTTDSVVNLHFTQEVNMFSSVVAAIVDSVTAHGDYYAAMASWRDTLRSYREAHRLPVVFKPVTINIREHIGEDVQVELVEQ